MKINLKKLTQDKMWLETVQRNLMSTDKAVARKLKGIIDLVSEIEIDLELGGESIVELDKARLEAIEERNKMLKFMNEADDM